MLSTSRVASVTVTPEGIFMTAESLQRSSCERRLHIEMSRRKSMSAAWMRSAFAPTAELAVSLKKICSFEPTSDAWSADRDHQAERAPARRQCVCWISRLSL